MRFKVSQEERDKVMASFVCRRGSTLSLGRTPVACSDYSFGYYSYNDVKDDYTMRNFSIDRDRFILIPYIKEAFEATSRFEDVGFSLDSAGMDESQRALFTEKFRH